MKKTTLIFAVIAIFVGMTAFTDSSKKIPRCYCNCEASADSCTICNCWCEEDMHCVVIECDKYKTASMECEK